MGLASSFKISLSQVDLHPLKSGNGVDHCELELQDHVADPLAAGVGHGVNAV